MQPVILRAVWATLHLLPLSLALLTAASPSCLKCVAKWVAGVPALPYEWGSPQRCEWELGAGQPLKNGPFPEEPVNPAGVWGPFEHQTQAWGTQSLQMPTALLWWLGLLIDTLLAASVVLSHHSFTLCYCKSPGQHLLWIFSHYDLKKKKEKLKSKPRL